MHVVESNDRCSDPCTTDTLAMWPYAFEAKYTVALKDDRLTTELAVTNTGDQAFDFTAALHTCMLPGLEPWLLESHIL